ncbi:MAG: protein-disulfide reductase DsbD domain-containing protein, partial [Vicinamibacterales bacterium]
MFGANPSRYGENAPERPVIPDRPITPGIIRRPQAFSGTSEFFMTHATTTRHSITAILIVCASMAGHAQLRPITPQVATFVNSTGAHGGSELKAALLVTLPEGLHVQSDQPRDPLLIPTALAFDPPPGVSVEEIVYPDSVDLTQAGVDQPLAVFEHEFVIGVRLAVSKNATPGPLAVPWRLRFQACDDTMCFAPATLSDTITINVVPQAEPVSPLHPERFEGIAFGTGHSLTIATDHAVPSS